MMRWLDRFPLPLLTVVALWLAVAPVVPEPHLIEKWRLLMQGALSKPIDIFDLLLHTVPLVLLALRLVRLRRQRRPGP
jgi:hypothetical protein